MELQLPKASYCSSSEVAEPSPILEVLKLLRREKHLQEATCSRVIQKSVLLESSTLLTDFLGRPYTPVCKHEVGGQRIQRVSPAFGIGRSASR